MLFGQRRQQAAPDSQSFGSRRWQAPPSLSDSDLLEPNFFEEDAPLSFDAQQHHQRGRSTTYSNDGRRGTPDAAPLLATTSRPNENHDTNLTQRTEPAEPPPRNRRLSVSPADVFGVARSADTQTREFQRMAAAGGVSVMDANDFFVYGGDEDDADHLTGAVPSTTAGNPRTYVRGTMSKLILKPTDDAAAIENAISASTLAPPSELGRHPRHVMHTMPDPSVVPPPRVDRPEATALPLPPPLKPSFLEVDLDVDIDDPFCLAVPTQSANKAPASGGALTQRSHPRYVPAAVKPFGHDEIHWTAPHEDREKEEARRRRATYMTDASVVERPPGPPTSTRDIVEQYRVRQRLVAYDESEAFGFRPRPLHDDDRLVGLRATLRQQQSRGELPAGAGIVTVRHGTCCYIFSADRREALCFDPMDADRNVAATGRWRYMALQDGSLFIGATAVPPVKAFLVPVPNVPYVVAATTSMLHILSLEDGVWFVCCLEGIESLRRLGWGHLINEQTLYVCDKTNQLHGLIPLRAALEELTVLRKYPHDMDTDSASFFVENRMKRLVATKLRLTPCEDKLLAMDNVPGVALCPRPEANHTWIFVYNDVAKKFLPWQRIENGTTFFVAMENHLVQDAVSVLFFAEELHRVDMGGVVPQHVGTRSGGAAPTQRILRVAQRLIIRNPPPESADDKHPAPHTADGGGGPKCAEAASTLSASSPNRRRPHKEMTHRLFMAGQPPSLMRWKRVGVQCRSATGTDGTVSATAAAGACASPLEDRMTLRDEVSQKMDLIIKARRSEVHTILPMHDRCAAVLSFDCKVYVVVELDRTAWMKHIAALEDT